MGDELRQVRAAAWNARLSGLRASAEAKAASGRGQHDTAARQRELADSYHALHQACRQRETVFAAAMADRVDWEAATRVQQHLAVAADAELRRRHPEQRFAPLRSAEPPSATPAQRDELTLTAGQPIPEMGQWVKDMAASRVFARTLADAIDGMGLTGVLQLTGVQDNLVHVLGHSHTDEISGTWTGLACPGHGLALGSDVDDAALRHLAAGSDRRPHLRSTQ